jgi:hypothetical protein
VLLIVEFFILNNSYINLLMSASALSMLTIWNGVKMYQRVIYIYIYYYIILYYILFYCIILYYIVLYYIILHIYYTYIYILDYIRLIVSATTNTNDLNCIIELEVHKPADQTKQPSIIAKTAPKES